MKTCQRSLVLMAALALGVANARADSLRVAPTKLFFTPGAETSILTLSNGGSREIAVQMSAMDWSHNVDGKDLYEPTADVIVFPKILQIAPGEERIIRVGYQGGPVAGPEKAYRIYAQELPVDAPGSEVMKFTIRIGVPVFARSESYVTEWSLAESGISPRGLRIHVQNSGSQHLMVKNVEAHGFDASGTELFSVEGSGWYVHAGNGRGFDLALSPEQCGTASTLQLAATVDDDTVTRTIDVDPADCSALQEAGTDSRTLH